MYEIFFLQAAGKVGIVVFVITSCQIQLQSGGR